MNPAGEDIPVVEFDEIDSTNGEAMRRASAGCLGPLWLTARRQTAGRGRSGRAWSTTDGNLAATMLFAPRCPLADLAGLSLVAGVATFDAIAKAIDSHALPALCSDLRLKWPNDAMLGGAKLSGILIESSNFSGETAVAIGIGINLAAAPQVSGRATTSLAAVGVPITPPQMSALLLASLTSAIGVWNRGRGFAEIREDWQKRAGPVGEATTVNSGRATLSGTYAGLDSDGALLLATPAGVRRITFGDVSIGAERPG